MTTTDGKRNEFTSFKDEEITSFDIERYSPPARGSNKIMLALLITCVLVLGIVIHYIFGK